MRERVWVSDIECDCLWMGIISLKDICISFGVGKTPIKYKLAYVFLLPPSVNFPNSGHFIFPWLDIYVTIIFTYPVIFFRNLINYNIEMSFQMIVMALEPRFLKISELCIRRLQMWFVQTQWHCQSQMPNILLTETLALTRYRTNYVIYQCIHFTFL